MGILDLINKSKQEMKEKGIHADIPFVPLAEDAGKQTEHEQTQMAGGISKSISASIPVVVNVPTQQNNGQAQKTFSLGKPKSIIQAQVPQETPIVSPTPPEKIQGLSLSPKKLNGSSVADGPRIPGVASPQVNQQPVVGAGSSLSVKQLESVDIKEKIDINTENRGSEGYSEKEVEEIRGALEFIKENFEHPEMVAEAYKMVMISLLNNPNLATLITPQDIGTIVRAARESRGIHVAKADDKADNRAKGKERQSEVDNFLGDILSSMAPK